MRVEGGFVEQAQLDELAGVELLRAGAQAAREPDLDALGGIGCGVVHTPGVGPLAGHVAGLLEQLAYRALQRRLAGVDLAGRDLQHDPAHRVAELPFQHDAPVVEQRHDRHRTGVHHVLASRRGAVGQAHMVAPQFEEVAAVQLLAALQLLPQVGIGSACAAGSRGGFNRPAP